MNIIIAGNGKVVATLARQLSAEGYDLTVIDCDQAVLEETIARYDVMAVNGNCASMCNTPAFCAGISSPGAVRRSWSFGWMPPASFAMHP